MPIECYINVSDLAICQRCPALFAYKFHRHEKSAWRVGIKGNGENYGSVFHKEISGKFFKAAANPKNSLYDEINFAVSKGADSLEKLVRDKFFIPFIETREKYLTSAQILAMAAAVHTWIQRMLIFFKDSRPVFLKPEEKLQGAYIFQDTKLIITGRYDALIFNPDKVETRLFEFKGFSKSNITVPLSQSLIYAWLLQKYSGIIPSIEIIYLDEKFSKNPEIFDSNLVKKLIISGLPGLFRSALDIILLRRLPEIMQDKNLCDSCKFKNTCKDDMKKIFAQKFSFKTKRRGASLLSLMVFFMAAIVITAQVFFFSNISSKAVKEDRDVQSARIQLQALTDEIIKDFIAKNRIVSGKRSDRTRAANLKFDKDVFKNGSNKVNYRTFYGDSENDNNVDSGGARASVEDNLYASGVRDLLYVHTYVASVDVFRLDYELDTTVAIKGKEATEASKPNEDWFNIPMHRRIFPAIKEDGYTNFLIRVHKQMPAGNRLMLQTLIASGDVSKGNKSIKTKTCEEIWY
ncbi:MAG: PD-(D/E)XK nuclease family protein [Synergistaceae bacterium]|nr:PD-(D/E)XK nuclease family protein [Synergistaceae bacterium]